MNKIRKGDEVIVLTGRDKGKRGTVSLRKDDSYLVIDGINLVKKHVKPNPMKGTTGGIVVTMFDSRTLHSRDVMARVVEVFGDAVFDTVINRTVRFPETSVAGEPITSWAPKSAGAIAYRNLAREVIARNEGEGGH